MGAWLAAGEQHPIAIDAMRCDAGRRLSYAASSGDTFNKVAPVAIIYYRIIQNDGRQMLAHLAEVASASSHGVEAGQDEARQVELGRVGLSWVEAMLQVETL